MFLQCNVALPLCCLRCCNCSAASEMRPLFRIAHAHQRSTLWQDDYIVKRCCCSRSRVVARLHSLHFLAPLSLTQQIWCPSLWLDFIRYIVYHRCCSRSRSGAQVFGQTTFATLCTTAVAHVVDMVPKSLARLHSLHCVALLLLTQQIWCPSLWLNYIF